MATKTFRTVYLNEDLDKRLLKMAAAKQSSASKVVRLALEQLLEASTRREMNKKVVNKGPALNA